MILVCSQVSFYCAAAQVYCQLAMVSMCNTYTSDDKSILAVMYGQKFLSLGITVWHHSAQPRDAKTVTLEMTISVRTSQPWKILILLLSARSIGHLLTIGHPGKTLIRMCRLISHC